MRILLSILLLTVMPQVHVHAQQISTADVIRIREFYRFASLVQDKIWPEWSRVPAPLLLVTDQGEFLTHHPAPPGNFRKLSDDFYSRERTFSTHLLATFPAFGPPSVIVIGEPESTSAKTSTPWLITVMHEHFHQLQNAQPEYYEGVENLGLTHGDKTGMWMLNYPFPYVEQRVNKGFDRVRNLLLETLAQPDPQKFARLAAQYSAARKQFFAQLSADDHKYLAFQLWQEGIARYTQIKCAEAAADFQPSVEYAALRDFQPFAEYAKTARPDTLDELRKLDISKSKREVVYSWGAAEGFLLDRLTDRWRDGYFSHPFSLDSFFDR